MLKTDPVIEANQTLEDMVNDMHAIAATNEKIRRALEIVNEIAFQTNILALNAAVGATREEEAGMESAVAAGYSNMHSESLDVATGQLVGMVRE